MVAGEISGADARWPRRLAVLHEGEPRRMVTRGNLDVLRHRTLALVCSVRCPGSLILQTYDLAVALREAEVTVAGGFHSPMEQECLRLLLRGRQPVIVCPARGIERMRVPVAWRQPLAEERLLVLSPFGEQERRATAETAQARNRFVAALADAVFVAHAAPGGRSEALCREVVRWGKPLLTFESEHNAHLVAQGARAVRAEDVRAWWSEVAAGAE